MLPIPLFSAVDFIWDRFGFVPTRKNFKWIYQALYPKAFYDWVVTCCWELGCRREQFNCLYDQTNEMNKPVRYRQYPENIYTTANATPMYNEPTI